MVTYTGYFRNLMFCLSDIPMLRNLNIVSWTSVNKESVYFAIYNEAEAVTFSFKFSTSSLVFWHKNQSLEVLIVTPK